MDGVFKKGGLCKGMFFVGKLGRFLGKVVGRVEKKSLFGGKGGGKVGGKECKGFKR